MPKTKFAGIARARSIAHALGVLLDVIINHKTMQLRGNLLAEKSDVSKGAECRRDASVCYLPSQRAE